MITASKPGDYAEADDSDRTRGQTYTKTWRVVDRSMHPEIFETNLTMSRSERNWSNRDGYATPADQPV